MQLTNDDLNFVNTTEGTQDPKLYYGQLTPVGASEPWASMPLGSVWVKTTASAVTWYVKVADADADADWQPMSSANGRTGFIDLDLESWREITTNDIGNLVAIGGVLATDSTPALEYTNGDTDSAIRLLWAGGNADPVARQFKLPPDFDGAYPMYVKVYAKMAGATDAPVISVDTFFDVGDTKVEDDIAAVTGTTMATYAATVAAADIPDTAVTCSIELTPGTHATDALHVHAIWVEYTRK